MGSTDGDCFLQGSIGLILVRRSQTLHDQVDDQRIGIAQLPCHEQGTVVKRECIRIAALQRREGSQMAETNGDLRGLGVAALGQRLLQPLLRLLPVTTAQQEEEHAVDQGQRRLTLVHLHTPGKGSPNVVVLLVKATKARNCLRADRLA